MSIEQHPYKPGDPLFEINIKDDVPISEVRNVMIDSLQSLQQEFAIDIKSSIVVFEPPCGCCKISMDFDKLPLEDLSCKCGKTKLIKYNKIID